MPNYDVIEDYNSYHGIKTTYGAAGMPKAECKTCNKNSECAKLAPWIKLCEKKEDENGH